MSSSSGELSTHSSMPGLVDDSSDWTEDDSTSDEPLQRGGDGAAGDVAVTTRYQQLPSEDEDAAATGDAYFGDTEDDGDVGTNDQDSFSTSLFGAGTGKSLFESTMHTMAAVVSDYLVFDSTLKCVPRIPPKKATVVYDYECGMRAGVVARFSSLHEFSDFGHYCDYYDCSSRSRMVMVLCSPAYEYLFLTSPLYIVHYKVWTYWQFVAMHQCGIGM